ncbi:MAG: CPBP family intramembrane metalloprotease [Candidatus Wallbacteria bacterium]|nr:CPBP family intramembrane metalloprotease [Candidatus Wallbacteria bacterium]
MRKKLTGFYSSLTASELMFVLTGIGIYLGSCYYFKEFPFLFVLWNLLAAIFLIRMNPSNEEKSGPDKKTAVFLICYLAVYLISMYWLTILGASIFYWLVQFLIPAAILKFMGYSLKDVNFEFKRIFSGFRQMLPVMIWFLPLLMFTVRDSEKILQIMKTPKVFLWLPLAMLQMLIMVAFWEEFLFRGCLMSSLKSLTGSPVIAVAASSLIFGIYHFPMRYLNVKSEFFHSFYGALAGCIQEQFLMGVLLAIAVYKTKNVWSGIWLHAFLNGFSAIYKISQLIKF